MAGSVLWLVANVGWTDVSERVEFLFVQPPPKAVEVAAESLRLSLNEQILSLKEAFDEVSFHRRKYILQQQSELLTAFIQSQGYYSADIKGKVLKVGDGVRRIHFDIDLGARYRLGNISIKAHDASVQNGKSLTLPQWSDLSDSKQRIAKAHTILTLQEDILNWVKERHCLLNTSVKHEVRLDHQNKQLDVVFLVIAPTEAMFGQVTYSGLKTVKADHLNQYLSFKRGQCFKEELMNESRLALRQSGLFTQVFMQPSHQVNEQGEVDIDISVTEREHRTLSLGLNYSSDIGPALNIGWEHRNLFSHSEKLDLQLQLAEDTQLFDAEITRPFFIREDQFLKLGLTLEEEESEAFKSTELSISASVERKLNRNWLASIGAEYGYDRVEDNAIDDVEDFALLRFPSHVAWDNRDNWLNPSRGMVIRTEIAPYIDTLNDDISFTRVELKSSLYRSFLKLGRRKSVFAVRTAMGGIIGDDTLTIPASERFYVGGGGSVRGYDFQSVGPLDESRDPLGGRSYFETSVEWRLPLLKDYGLVSFIDGGAVFDDTSPDFQKLDQEMQWGLGLGVRYYSILGPLRFDLAHPVNQRSDIDDAFQFYISVGEAF